MGFLNWYDWIQPTNPFASIFFGLIFSIIITLVVWFDTKEAKTCGVVLVTGIGVSIIGVVVLNTIGYYG
ncbi:hypothetical protein SAMN05192533_108185 [Mesobacillus persicus]|uniref:Uncharacterized protein n=1 Tax=Mesobacillus persicus TaxID=930146 RepID=A0A1H8DEA6_9BACI|nr:hypothetical protein [Mesobacillus persicus]SEN05609.1 hypothetical protein SAMN05192533_108185 [Mesobacillus persicus]